MIRARCKGMSLTVRGHAGTAPYGQDLVCAAVTALLYALAQRLTELEVRGAFKKPPVIRLAPGNARIFAVPKGAYAGKVQEDFRLLQSGMKLLAQHYPEQIKVEWI